MNGIIVCKGYYGKWDRDFGDRSRDGILELHYSPTIYYNIFSWNVQITDMISYTYTSKHLIRYHITWSKTRRYLTIYVILYAILVLYCNNHIIITH